MTALVEIIEVTDHPWFVAVQFHPEFKSKPTRPHPLFSGFVQAAVRRSSKEPISNIPSENFSSAVDVELFAGTIE